MAITREAYTALQQVVGPEFITDDPILCEGYRSGPAGYESATGYEKVMTMPPGAVILPRTTEDVQKIVKICNRYKVAYVPWSTGFYGPRSHCHVKNELIIDMKRMRDFEMDDKHWYATVQPGVTYSPLQAECFKRGGYVVVGGGGAQVSVVANMICDGWSPLSLRIGFPHRRILGVELVLPDGEIVRMGSLAVQDDAFWGEGIGPDLRGMLRGYTGLLGCLGIVTKLALKILPFQPEELKPTGISPNTGLELPTNRIKWLNYQVPTKEAETKVMYEIGRAEIAAAVTKVPVFWRAIAKAEGKEEFWDIWNKETEESIRNFHLVRVLLIGYTSEAQMRYDEAVLNDIVAEVGGVQRPTKPIDQSWLKNADSAGMWLMTGAYVSVDYIIESIPHADAHGPTYAELKAQYTPPLMPDYRDPAWTMLCEAGHQGYSEYLVYWDPDETTDPVDQFYVETSKMNIRERFYTSLLASHQPLYLTGPHYGPNYHEWILKVKEEFDPVWICHPPVPLASDEFVNRAPWMKPVKDWDSPEPLPIPKW